MRPEDQPVAGRDLTATNVTHADPERRREGIEVFQVPVTSFGTIGRHGGTLERGPPGQAEWLLRAEGLVRRSCLRELADGDILK